MMQTKVGSWRGVWKHQDGTSQVVTLHNVGYVPELWVHLFSITKAMEQGYEIRSKGLEMHLIKQEISLKFDKIIETQEGHLIAAECISKTPESATVATVAPGKSIPYETMHKILGHAGSDKIRATAKHYGIKLTGAVCKCEDCAKAKIRQKNLNKLNLKSATKPAERLCLDLSTIDKTSMGGNKHWILVVDEATKMKWSFFVSTKDQLSNKVLPLIRSLIRKGVKIENVRMDNAGENLIFSDKLSEEFPEIKVEFTPRDTPQHNGMVERAFATLYGCTRAMMHDASIPADMQVLVCCKAISHVTRLDGLMIAIINDQTKHDMSTY